MNVLQIMFKLGNFLFNNLEKLLIKSKSLFPVRKLSQKFSSHINLLNVASMSTNISIKYNQCKKYRDKK